MLKDRLLEFARAQAITATADAAVDLDLVSILRDAGPGTPVYLAMTVSETFATLTNLVVSLTMDDNAGFGSAKTIFSSGAILAADLVANKAFYWALPHGMTERYFRAIFTVTGSDATAGVVDLFLTLMPQANDMSV